MLVDGSQRPAAEALAFAGVEPYEPQPKEGIALINGSPFATALGIALAKRAARLVGEATTAAALGLALTRSGARALSPRVGALTGDAFALLVQVRLTELLEGPMSGVTASSLPSRRGSSLRSTGRHGGPSRASTGFSTRGSAAPPTRRSTSMQTAAKRPASTPRAPSTRSTS